MGRMYGIEKIASLALLVAMAALASCGAGASASALPTATSGSVRLQVGATIYHTNDTIVITITNQGASTVYIYNEGTDCGLIGLQRFVNDQWGGGADGDGIPRCSMLQMPQAYPLPKEGSFSARLVPPSGGWPSGEYRAGILYRLTPHGPNVVSPTYSAGCMVS